MTMLLTRFINLAANLNLITFRTHNSAIAQVMSTKNLLKGTRQRTTSNVNFDLTVNIEVKVQFN